MQQEKKKANTVMFFQSEEHQNVIEERIKRLNDPYRQRLGSPCLIDVKILQITKAHLSEAKSSPNDKKVALIWAACGDSTAKLVRINIGSTYENAQKPASSGSIIKVLKGHSGPVTCVSSVLPIHNDKNQFVLTGSWDKTIRLWNVTTGQAVGVYSGHSDFVKTILVPKNSSSFFSGSSDGKLRKWSLPADTKNLQSIDFSSNLVMEGHKRSVDCLATSPDQLILYSGGSDTKVLSWNTKTGAPITISAMEKMSANGISHGDTAGGHWCLPHKSNVFDIAVTDNSIWTASADKSVYEWDPYSGAKETELVHSQVVKSVLVVPEKGVVFTGSREGVIKIWNMTSGECVKEIQAHVDSVESILLVEGTALSASLDGSILQWDIKDVLTHDGYLYQPLIQGVRNPGAELEPASTGTQDKPKPSSLLTVDEDKELEDLLNELEG